MSFKDRVKKAQERSIRTAVEIDRSEDEEIYIQSLILRKMTTIFPNEVYEDGDDLSMATKLMKGSTWSTLGIRIFSYFNISLEMIDPENIIINYESPNGKRGRTSIPVPDEDMLSFIIERLDALSENGRGGFGRLVKKAFAMFDEERGDKRYSEKDHQRFLKYPDYESMVVACHRILKDGEKPKIEKIPLVMSISFIAEYLRGRDKERIETINEFQFSGLNLD